MSRVLTFSRQFPAYHPKADMSTGFVEKILKSHRIGYDTCVHKDSFGDSFYSLNPGKEKYVDDFISYYFEDPFEYTPKYHTIRAGHYWKAGDWFKPVVWTLPGGRFTKGNKQIQFAPDMQVKKVWDFRIASGCFGINEKIYSGITEGDHELLERVANNDGLTKYDFVKWFDFSKPFDGQIISWSDHIEY